MKSFITRQPLLFVLLGALLIRVPAVIWSKGYMASDDQFETVRLAYDWVRTTPWYEDGLRLWPSRPAAEQTRYPLYVSSLYAVMKGCQAVGLEDLDSMMYVIRALHALLSLLTVWAMFEIVLAVTRSRKWAIAAGLAGAAFFVMPFLSVRTLIEVVGGTFWTVALLRLYRYDQDRRNIDLIWAAGLTTLAWMIRFEIAFAALPIPILLWFRHKTFGPAIRFALWTIGLVLLASVAEIFLVDGFMASTLAHIRQVVTESPPYRNEPWFYLPVLLGLLIPPFSLLAIYLWCNRKAAKEQLVLWGSTLFFIVAHTLSISRQERYLLPILPALLLMTIIGSWYHLRANGLLSRKRTLGRWLLVSFVVVNCALLVPLTVYYPHKGLVAPLVWIETQPSEEETPTVLMMSPDDGHLYPLTYGGLKEIDRFAINAWGDLESLANDTAFFDRLDYVVFYPLDSLDLNSYLESVEHYSGELREIKHIEPTLIAKVAHALNPKHNPTLEAYIFAKRTSY